MKLHSPGWSTNSELQMNYSEKPSIKTEEMGRRWRKKEAGQDFLEFIQWVGEQGWKNSVEKNLEGTETHK